MCRFLIILFIFMPSFLFAGKKKIATAKQFIFKNNIPKHYRVFSQGRLRGEINTHGYYIILQNKKNKILMLLVDYKRNHGQIDRQIAMPNLPREGLEQQNWRDLANHLFIKYVRFHSTFYIKQEGQFELLLSSFYYPIAWLRVRFPNSFEEPDILTRLDYKDGHSVIVMMGLPGSGFYNKRKTFRSFDKHYDKMMQELQKLVNTSGLAQGLIKSKHKK